MHPRVQHDDLFHLAHGEEPVRDGDGGALLNQFIQRGLNSLLGSVVQGAGGLVEHENARVALDGARQRNALLLAAGEALL